ncbi:conserved hypothetical protein [Ricinus communis]|uniref:Uncharacterized protein n=1 Tax=Ricinus communis TaxID=3988 RepID=B9S829_RICCO|nr:conserved hypothetical protein [Ricinus communis]
MPRNPKGGIDSWIWDPNKFGVFSVRSAYFLIQDHIGSGSNLGATSPAFMAIANSGKLFGPLICL